MYREKVVHKADAVNAAEEQAAVAIHWRAVRAVVWGLVLVLMLCALTTHSNLLYRRYITAASLPSGAVFFFFLTVVLNGILKRIHAHWAMQKWELGIVFSMLFISAAIPQASIGQTLVTLAVAPQYYPRRGGVPYAEQLGDAIPSWLLVRDREAVRAFYEGLAPGQSIPWGAWVVPMLGWTVFALALLGALGCLARILSHRWIEEERVTFPLMELPLEMMGAGSEGDRFWRSPLLWLGFLIPGTMIGIGQMHSYFPTIPEIGQIITWRIGEGWQTAPLNALRDLVFPVWMLVIGVSYLINGEVAASIWVFHLLYRAQLLAFALMGYNAAAPAGTTTFNPMDWIHHTEFGACVVLSISMLLPVWGEVKKAWRGDRSARVPRGAVLGFLAANGAMLVWALVAGRNVIPVLLFLLVLYAIVLALGRMVASGGVYLVDNGYVPERLIHGLTGSLWQSNSGLWMLNAQNALVGRADMSFVYFALNDEKFRHEARLPQRVHLAGVVLSVLAALLGAYFFILWWSYQYGAVNFAAWPLSWNVPQHLQRLMGDMASRQPPSGEVWSATIVGAGVGLFLLAMNRQFTWWRISPLGFVIASSENVSGQIWGGAFIGWLISSLVKRYGGMPVHRRLRPFFLGLILGDVVVYCTVVLLESVIGVRGAGF
jgi:hypothetical protein